MGIPDCRPTPIRRPSPGWAPCGSQLCCSGDLRTKLYPSSCLRKDVEWSGEDRPSRAHGYRAMRAQRSCRQNAYRLSRYDTPAATKVVTCPTWRTAPLSAESLRLTVDAAYLLTPVR